MCSDFWTKRDRHISGSGQAAECGVMFFYEKSSPNCFNQISEPHGTSNTKQDGHVYVMSSDHGNSDGGGTGDIGSDEYLHYKVL